MVRRDFRKSSLKMNSIVLNPHAITNTQKDTAEVRCSLLVNNCLVSLDPMNSFNLRLTLLIIIVVVLILILNEPQEDASTSYFAIPLHPELVPTFIIMSLVVLLLLSCRPN